MINWIIKKLGGTTADEQASYEKWAVENLTGKNGEVTPDCLLYIPFDGDDIVVIRSRITICNGIIKGLKVAPWCKDVVASGLNIVESKD